LKNHTDFEKLVLETPPVRWGKDFGFYCLTVLALLVVTFVGVVISHYVNYGEVLILTGFIVSGAVSAMGGIMFIPFFIIWKMSYYQMTIYGNKLILKRRSKLIELSFNEINKITAVPFSWDGTAKKIGTATIVKKDGSKPLVVRFTDFKTSSKTLETTFVCYISLMESEY